MKLTSPHRTSGEASVDGWFCRQGGAISLVGAMADGCDVDLQGEIYRSFRSGPWRINYLLIQVADEMVVEEGQESQPLEFD